MNAFEKIMKQMEVANKVKELANEVNKLRDEAAVASATAQILRDQGKREEAELYSKIIENCYEKSLALQEEAEQLHDYYVQNLMF